MICQICYAVSISMNSIFMNICKIVQFPFMFLSFSACRRWSKFSERLPEPQGWEMFWNGLHTCCLFIACLYAIEPELFEIRNAWLAAHSRRLMRFLCISIEQSANTKLIIDPWAGVHSLVLRCFPVPPQGVHTCIILALLCKMGKWGYVT